MDGKCLVAYIITERQPFGPDGPKWYILHTFFVLNVLKLKREDKKLRLLFVCPPFCFPLFWSPKVTSVSFDTLESKKPTVMVVQWMILVVRVLAPESAKLAFSFLDEKVSGCFLFLWYIIYAGMGQFGHISAATLALAVKNMMDILLNHFRPECTNQRRTVRAKTRTVGFRTSFPPTSADSSTTRRRPGAAIQASSTIVTTSAGLCRRSRPQGRSTACRPRTPFRWYSIVSPRDSMGTPRPRATDARP
mmetsp:Transcript_24985/g.59369  ORF Transcript_24985/g.59369 Transcript_24985/m.59369 type:complete len:248 (+) Transcript_24985:1782-2525(+)